MGRRRRDDVVCFVDIADCQRGHTRFVAGGFSRLQPEFVVGSRQRLFFVADRDNRSRPCVLARNGKLFVKFLQLFFGRRIRDFSDAVNDVPVDRGQEYTSSQRPNGNVAALRFCIVANTLKEFW